MKRCEGTLILAKVASEAILASEVIAGINDALALSKGKISQDAMETQRKALTEEVIKGINELPAPGNDRSPLTQSQLRRQAMIRQLLKQQIEMKLICHDARRTIPAENLPHVEKGLAKHFEEVELKKLMEQHKVETRRELAEKLRTMGTSLEREKRTFVQRTLARQWVHQQVKLDGEDTYDYDQMWEYYRRHLAEFERPAGVRWEHLMIRFSQYPGKQEAYAAIVRMGNQVFDGIPLAEVARADSHGPTASEGGLREWPSKTLVSDRLKKAIAGLPAGQLSPILEDWRGYHIIRVIERREAGRTPFAEAQAEIRQKIRQQRTKQQWQAYLLRLRQEIPVWTIFDDQTEGPQISGRSGYSRR